MSPVRILVVVDGDNLEASLQRSKQKVDHHQLFKAIERQYGGIVARAEYFSTWFYKPKLSRKELAKRVQEQKYHFYLLRQIGYTIKRFEPVFLKRSGRWRGYHDNEIRIAIRRMAPKYNLVVLISDDRDFDELSESISKLHIIALSPDRKIQDRSKVRLITTVADRHQGLLQTC